jgi:hypothetical protein
MNEIKKNDWRAYRGGHDKYGNPTIWWAAGPLRHTPEEAEYDANIQQRLDVAERKVADLEGRTERALKFVFLYGAIEGESHKTWVIDQVARCLHGNNYDAFVRQFEENGKYFWNTGVAP